MLKLANTICFKPISLILILFDNDYSKLRRVEFELIGSNIADLLHVVFTSQNNASRASSARTTPLKNPWAELGQAYNYNS